MYGFVEPYKPHHSWSSNLEFFCAFKPVGGNRLSKRLFRRLLATWMHKRIPLMRDTHARWMENALLLKRGKKLVRNPFQDLYPNVILDYSRFLDMLGPAPVACYEQAIPDPDLE